MLTSSTSPILLTVNPTTTQPSRPRLLSDLGNSGLGCSTIGTTALVDALFAIVSTGSAVHNASTNPILRTLALRLAEQFLEVRLERITGFRMIETIGNRRFEIANLATAIVTIA